MKALFVPNVAPTATGAPGAHLLPSIDLLGFSRDVQMIEERPELFAFHQRSVKRHRPM